MTKFDAIPTSEAVTLVEVVAPATLPEGFTFEATYRGDTFTVKVPKGGVTKGQQFQASYQSGITDQTALADAVPVGRWKDGICSCLKYGCCHPSFLCGWFCTPCLLAQVMTRLNLNIWGRPGTPAEVKNTFTFMKYLFLGYFVFQIIFKPSPALVSNGEIISFTPPGFLFSIVRFCFFIYTITIMIRTRRAAREQYGIPNYTCCNVSNDCCCAFWFGYCNVALMARQTADYDNEQARFCTETGLLREAPILVV